ncbi:T9SS type A sorting domain-containing protein [Flavobacterium sp.]|uniref:T9SS type A sorting domain-containing protein n=1 Tax=Flavobacterium sp. TaxID=239 RepID=UPI000EEB0330|nr:T9SS type A sorting domain-containing protein [Flavobacterium sp.]HCQ14019.1 hypothetical protein [Flavobacterium sp.]
MKKIYSLLFSIVTASAIAQQPLPFYEGFNYTAGATFQTQPGVVAINTGDDLLIGTGSLSYTGLTASTGNKLTFDGAGIDAGKDFASQTANTVYYSFLLNVTDLAATTSTTGGYYMGLVQGTSSSFGSTLWIKKIDATTFNIGTNARTTAANTVFSSTAYNVNTTYLVVLSYTFNAAAGDDVAKLWVNPTIGGSEPTALASHTNAGGSDLTSVSRLLFRQGSATDTPFLQIDEVRVGLTWNDVTTTTAPLAVGENTISGLNVYPNPVKNGIFYITTDANAERTVTVFDIVGKQVLNTTTSESAINVANLNSGVYMVQITEEGKTATKKLVIR